MANCGAKLLASASRARLDPLVDGVLSRRRFGFRRSLSSLTPVAEVNMAMQRVSSGGRTRGGALFFDCIATFPSLAHNTLLRAVLWGSGFLDSVTLAIKALSKDNRDWFLGRSMRRAHIRFAAGSDKVARSALSYSRCALLVL